MATEQAHPLGVTATSEPPSARQAVKQMLDAGLLDEVMDRKNWARDRNQAVIEREQADPRDLPPTAAVDPRPGPWPGSRRSRDQPITPSERAIATSQQRISDSQEKITRDGCCPPPKMTT
jgi:hypothetical protein